jgi:hypothetical protein
MATSDLRERVEVLVEQFKDMRVGTSFFVPEVEPADVEFLRRPVTRAGCGIKIVRVENDEIYCQPGVRIWREEGSFDEL